MVFSLSMARFPRHELDLPTRFGLVDHTGSKLIVHREEGQLNDSLCCLQPPSLLAQTPLFTVCQLLRT